MKSKRYGLLVLGMVAILALSGCSLFPKAPEVPDDPNAMAFEEIIPSLGTKTSHWWEEKVWIEDIDLTDMSLEIRYAGKYILIDFFKFVSLEGGPEIMWTDFEAAPTDKAQIVNDISTYKKEATFWAVRTGVNGGVNQRALHSVAGMSSLPDLRYDLGLTGRYKVIIGLRATDFDAGVEVRFAK